MPKNKDVTNAKLRKVMREEFLLHGYEKAALNVMARRAGITPAGIYRHFANKEEMFASLVEPALGELFSRCERDYRLTQAAGYDPFGEEALYSWMDLFYGHFEEWKLLLCRSHGSKYEQIEEEMIRREKDSMRELYPHVREEEAQFIASVFIRSLLLPIREDMTYEQALSHTRLLRRFLYPGWRELLSPEG